MIKKAPLLIVLIPLFLLITPAYAGNATIQTTAGLIQITTPGMVILPDPAPVLTLHEKTTRAALEEIGFKPTLRAYYIDKSDDIWHPNDASSYITPNSPWVQYYAKLGETPQLDFKSDKELYPLNSDEDYWQNADYTLYTGTGDCEDITIAKVSIYIAMEYKAMAVSGYIEDNKGNRYRDTWTEFFNPKTGIKSTILTTADALTTTYTLSPLYMFNDKTQWGTYDGNWNNY